MCIIHRTFCFHGVICITSQKSRNGINKSRQEVCLALCITSVPIRQWHLHQSRNLFTITIENLLHFLKYFDDKANSVKDFPLGFVKVRSTHLSFGFLNKCGKIWKRKDRENILCSTILNLGSVSSCCLAMNPRSPPERRLGAWGWALFRSTNQESAK